MRFRRRNPTARGGAHGYKYIGNPFYHFSKDSFDGRQQSILSSNIVTRSRVFAAAAAAVVVDTANVHTILVHRSAPNYDSNSSFSKRKYRHFDNVLDVPRR